MPPEFIPSERRRKKKEPLKPKEPKSIDDHVDDIMKDYRDKQRELGNVDNWGQPNEKLDRKKVEKWVRKNLPKLNDNDKEVKKRGGRKFSPKAPTESMSEAIGNKLKEKADTQKDKQKKSKTPKTSKPRKSKPSPKERKSPEPKSPSKNEPRKQLGPKIKTKPSEVKRKKIRFPRAPTEGMSKAIGGKLREKAEQLKDRQKTPTISKPRKSMYSPKEKSSPEPKSPVKREHNNTPQMKKPSNKEKKERLGPKLKMKPPEVQRRKIESLRDPTESLSEAIGKKLIQNREMKSLTEQKRTTGIPVKDTKVGNSHEVKLYTPEIRGVKIQSESALRKFVNDDLAGMKHVTGFDKMMNDAIAHIRLRKLVGHRKNLTFPEIRKLSNQIDVPLRTTRKWTTEFGNPKFYKLAESAITKTEAKIILDKLKQKRNEVDSIKEIEKRLSTLYIRDHVQQLKSYTRDIETSGKYFKFLEHLSEGGIVTDMARRAGVSPLTGRNYTNGQFPHLVKRAADIPPNKPEDGWKWLPLPRENRSLEVPEKIEDWSQILKVLNQLDISKDKLSELSSRYGIHDKETAFMYALGGIISDGSLTAKGPSSRMTLPLSKKYGWSPRFGKAVSLSLESLGIHAERKSDWKSPDNIIMDKGKERKITGPGFRVWGSEKHPLLIWVRRSCLGLKPNQNKVENPINAKWTLSAPRKDRRALIQGIADGDGYVSVNSQYAALSTKVNQIFFKELLKSFGVESSETEKDVRILQTESILRFAEIKPFNHALSRKNDLNELRTLIVDRKAKDASSRISKKEIDFAQGLRSRGKSYGEITRLLYRKFSISWDISTVEHAIKRQNKSASQKERG